MLCLLNKIDKEDTLFSLYTLTFLTLFNKKTNTKKIERKHKFSIWQLHASASVHRCVRLSVHMSGIRLRQNCMMKAGRVRLYAQL